MFLIGIMIAKAVEVFFEKGVDEKNASGLVAKVAGQASLLCTSLCVKEKESLGDMSLAIIRTVVNSLESAQGKLETGQLLLPNCGV